MSVWNQDFLTRSWPSINRAQVGGWVELGRTTLGGVNDTIDISSLANKRYYMILFNTLNSGSINDTIDFNADVGTNYARRYNTDGTGEGTSVSSTSLLAYGAPASDNRFGYYYVSNLSSKEKLAVGHAVRDVAAGATGIPSRRENAGKWDNTSNSIDQVTVRQVAGGDFASGSEVVVLGWDESDTHTTNFWEELSSDDLSGGAAASLTSNFTAKKYLWVQYYQIADSGTISSKVRFNSDVSSNYTHRVSDNGGTDATATSQTSSNLLDVATDSGAFVNMFIINNSANEKLVIVNSVSANATGATGIPDRVEKVFKWVNTSTQISSIAITKVAGTSTNFGTGTSMRVWGSD